MYILLSVPFKEILYPGVIAWAHNSPISTPRQLSDQLTFSTLKTSIEFSVIFNKFERSSLTSWTIGSWSLLFCDGDGLTVEVGVFTVFGFVYDVFCKDLR